MGLEEGRLDVRRIDRGRWGHKSGRGWVLLMRPCSRGDLVVVVAVVVGGRMAAGRQLVVRRLVVEMRGGRHLCPGA